MQSKHAAAEVPAKNVITTDAWTMGDIKHNICEFLDGIKSGCSFATSGVFFEAPLPDLCLDGYGPIPLPLAHRDFNNICKERREGDAGKERVKLYIWTIIANIDHVGLIPRVVKSVDRASGKYLQNQWEMQSDSVSLHNPAWNKLVQKIAVKAARDLGINRDAAAVAAKLAKVHIWAAAACIPPHRAWVAQTSLNCFFH